MSPCLRESRCGIDHVGAATLRHQSRGAGATAHCGMLRHSGIVSRFVWNVTDRLGVHPSQASAGYSKSSRWLSLSCIAGDPCVARNDALPPMCQGILLSHPFLWTVDWFGMQGHDGGMFRWETGAADPGADRARNASYARDPDTERRQT